MSSQSIKNPSLTPPWRLLTSNILDCPVYALPEMVKYMQNFPKHTMHKMWLGSEKNPALAKSRGVVRQLCVLNCKLAFHSAYQMNVPLLALQRWFGSLLFSLQVSSTCIFLFCHRRLRAFWQSTLEQYFCSGLRAVRMKRQRQNLQRFLAIQPPWAIAQTGCIFEGKKNERKSPGGSRKPERVLVTETWLLPPDSFFQSAGYAGYFKNQCGVGQDKEEKSGRLTT